MAVFHPGCSRSIVPLAYTVGGQICMESESACMHGDSCVFRLVVSYQLSEMGQYMRLPLLPPMIRCSRSLSHCIFCYRASVDLLRIKNDVEELARVSSLYSDHFILGTFANKVAPPLLIQPTGLSVYIDFYDTAENRILPSRVAAARILMARCHVELPFYSVIVFCNCEYIYMAFTKSEIEYIIAMVS